MVGLRSVERRVTKMRVQLECPGWLASNHDSHGWPKKSGRLNWTRNVEAAMDDGRSSHAAVHVLRGWPAAHGTHETGLSETAEALERHADRNIDHRLDRRKYLNGRQGQGIPQEAIALADFVAKAKAVRGRADAWILSSRTSDRFARRWKNRTGAACGRLTRRCRTAVAAP